MKHRNFARRLETFVEAPTNELVIQKGLQITLSLRGGVGAIFIGDSSPDYYPLNSKIRVEQAQERITSHLDEMRENVERLEELHAALEGRLSILNAPPEE